MSKIPENNQETLEIPDINAASSRPVMALAALVAIAAIVAFYFVFRFAEADRARGLQAWQNQLNVVADSRAGAIADWFDASRSAVQKVASNQSVSFYLTELSWTAKAEKVTDGDARRVIIGNFLKWSAAQSGFDAPPTGASVGANIDRKARAGLAVTDAKGALLVSTPFTPPIEATLARYRDAKPASGVYVSEVFTGPAGDPSVAFVARVYAEQAAADNQIVGYIVGVRPLGADMFARLRQPGDVTRTGETYLVAQDGNQIDYISPLADGSPPMTRHLAADTPDLAEAFALAKPGGFAIKRNYNGNKVLVTSRALETPAWTLVRTVGADEALGEIDRRRASILTILGLAILTVAAGLLLIWRHGASVRVAHEAARFAAMASRFEKLSRFLRIVSDSQPTSISVVDSDGVYKFVNTAAAREAGMKPDDMTGKKLGSVLPPYKVRLLSADNQKVLESRQPLSTVHGFQEEDGLKVVKADHIPLDVQPDGGYDKGVLMVRQDITDVVKERERRENNLRQLVTTLATIIDSRDPYSADHSKRVAEVSEAIAQQMELSDTEVETAEIAGALMNLGKIMVPRNVLTRPEQISQGELTDIRRNILMSAELLQGLEFDGPVVATIRQVQAHWDGSGLPAGLQGEDILITARIVAVANAFVGMVSVRAHRPGLDFDTAIRYLLQQVDKAYDRRPVAALANYLDNRNGRARWARFGQPPVITSP